MQRDDDLRSGRLRTLGHVGVSSRDVLWILVAQAIHLPPWRFWEMKQLKNGNVLLFCRRKRGLYQSTAASWSSSLAVCENISFSICFSLCLSLPLFQSIAKSFLWCLSQALLLISPYCSYDSYCSSCSLLILNSAWSLDVVKLVQANVSWGRCCTLGPPCLPPRHPFGALKHPSHGIWMHLNALVQNLERFKSLQISSKSFNIFSFLMFFAHGITWQTFFRAMLPAHCTFF